MLEKGLNQEETAVSLKISVSTLKNYLGGRIPKNKRAWLLHSIGEGEQTLSNGHSESLTEGTSSVVRHRYFAGGVGAGPGQEQEDTGEYIITPVDVLKAWTSGRTLDSDEAYWTRVRGTSMEPWLPDGTPILVEVVHGITAAGRYVLYFDDDDGEEVKRIEKLGGGAIKVVSDNPAHVTRTLRPLGEDMYSDDDNDLRLRVNVRGRVVFPPDTPQAILSTITQQMSRLVNR
ncbi:MAG: S24 family peptidase [Bacteroidota bacterium]